MGILNITRGESMDPFRYNGGDNEIVNKSSTWTIKNEAQKSFMLIIEKIFF